MARCRHPLLIAEAILAFAVMPAAAEPVAVAVLNFANQVQGPAGQQWNWLEKGLADLVINDLSTQEGLLLVDRERMQETLTAEGIPIRPGMDLSRVTQVFVKRFKVARLVFGSFRVDGENARLTASIVDAHSGKLIRRVQSMGAASHVLKLEKELSGRIVAALLGRGDVQEIAASLPVWTESLPASKLLYTSVDKFDRGEFSEAWLYSRRAWRADRGYADALYWVGRLHYYMLQYAHARRYYERFVHEHATHPRVGDAILEYIDTCERTSVDPAEIIAVYDDVLTHAPPDTTLVNVFGSIGRKTSLRDWLKYQLGNYCVEATEYARAVRLVLPTLARGGRHHSNENEAKLTLLKVARAKALLALGTAIQLKGNWHHSPDLGWHPPRPVLFLRPGRTNVDLLAAVEGWWDHEGNWPYGQVIYAAPPGFVFASAGFKASADEVPAGEAILELIVNNGAIVEKYIKDKAASWTHSRLAPGSVSMAPTLPPACQAFSTDLQFWLRVGKRRLRSTHARLTGLTAELAMKPRPAGPTGAIWVDFPTGLRRIHLDGRALHSQEGTIGGIPPGRHTVRVNGVDHQVNVPPGGIVQIRPGHPPYVPGPVSGWSRPVFVARSTRNPVQRCAVDFDDAGKPQGCHLVRGRNGRLVVIWVCDDDLWIAASDDLGESWSGPRLLPVPVNSAHSEAAPGLGQLPDGRWAILFTSDRFIPRRRVLYACWSWDLSRWSNPRVILDYSAGRGEYEVWPNGGHPLLVWPDGRLGMRATCSPLGATGSHPAIIFHDPARRQVSHKAAVLYPKGLKLWASVWGLVKDRRDDIHLLYRIRPQTGLKYEDTVCYTCGAEIDGLTGASVPANVLKAKLAFGECPLSLDPFLLGGEVFLAWQRWPERTYRIGRPAVENGQLQVREVARIPAPAPVPVGPVEVHDNILGYLTAEGRAVVFRKLDLTKALAGGELKDLFGHGSTAE